MNMRVLLTGGTGFIGSALIPYLLTQGLSISALGRQAVSLLGVENILVEQLIPGQIEAVLSNRSFDVIIHLAAAGVNPKDRDSANLINVNTILPEFLVRYAARCGAKAVLITGSSSEYSVTAEQEKLTEQAAIETGKLYGASKAAGGILALAQGAASNVSVAVLRLFNVYGYGEASHRLSTSLVSNLITGKRVSLSPGKQIRDFVYIEDVCNGLWQTTQALLADRLSTGAYNLATGIGTSIRDFACLLASCLGESEKLLDFGAIPIRADDLPYVVGDNTQLKKLINWQPTWTLEAGLRDMLAKSSAIVGIKG